MAWLRQGGAGQQRRHAHSDTQRSGNVTWGEACGRLTAQAKGARPPLACVRVWCVGEKCRGITSAFDPSVLCDSIPPFFSQRVRGGFPRKIFR